METITNFREWLREECPKEDIRFLDEAETISYVPIARLERLLDNFHKWGTSEFKFTVFRTSNHWFASGSLLLIVTFFENNKKVRFYRTGAATIFIGSDIQNKDFEATILSLALSNAAKKLGPKFGRHLNGRLEDGETFYIDAPVEVIDENPETKRWKALIDGSKSSEGLAKHLKGLPKELKPYYMTKLKSLSNGNY